MSSRLERTGIFEVGLFIDWMMS